MKKKESPKPEEKKKSSKKSSPNKKDFIVVGLGASAGGVKAIQEFFATMPPSSGMAFVVILHLSPEYESNLKEIVQARTQMPVTLVNETHRVEPNHVYVIPPNRHLEMADGVIRSLAPLGDQGARVAIDVFFRTLAEEYQNNAVCLVLSGTGSDGTLGVKAIKERNGFAIVQAPEDAEYDAMPRNAISTGIVDWILPVKRMPESLIKFRDGSARLHLTTDDGDHDDTKKVASEIQADESLREILTVLRVRTGHDFSNYKTPTLIRRIARHLQIYDLEDIPAYLQFLRQRPEDVQLLLKNLLINVTNFFRDKDVWAVLEREVVPNLFAGKNAGDMIRAWSCGCASGEEAYSLAIILTEYADKLPDPPKIQVFATDVDEDAIAEAREHLYPQSIEADVSPERLKRFFVKEGKNYRVKKEMRETVLFAPHNVLRDPPFSRLDLISCRNLLIYLNRDTQERLMEIFHFALASHGYLFLGSSETAENPHMLFVPVDKKLRIYRRRGVIASPQPAPQMPIVGRWEVRLPEIKTGKKVGHRPFSLGEVHYKLLEQVAPPSIMVSQDFEIQYTSDSAGRYLRFKGGEPSNNLMKLVLPDLLPDLRAALFTVQREKKAVEFEKVHANIEGAATSVNIIVRPVEIENESSDYLLVLFDEDRKVMLQKDGGKAAPVSRPQDKDDAMESVVVRLEEELARTKDSLRATIEQHEISVEELKASNEELQAINEELRSTTEELETSKEELQSVNEELTTVNHELKEKMEETTRTNADLQNLMASTDIATIFLDRQFNIKRFTSPVEYLFHITSADIRRPLEHFTHRLDYPDLQKDAALVLKTLTPTEREVRDDENRTYLTRFVPYRAADDRIEGVVLNFVDITERKRAEEAMRESREKVYEILESIGDALYSVDESWNFTYVNSKAEQIWGKSRGELLGRNIWEVFPNVVGTPPYEQLQRAFNERVQVEFETFSPVINFWIEVNAYPTKQGGLTVYFHDITARKQTEDAMLESGERFAKAISVETVGVIFFDREGKLTNCNDAFLEMVGYSRKQIESGKIGWRDLTPDEWMKRSEQALVELEATGRISPYEKQYFRKDGSRFWGLFAGSKISDDETVEYIIDISRSKEAEELLRKSEEHLNLILESTKDYAIVTFDLKGRITRWNAGAEKIFGWTQEEALGQTTHLLFTPEDIAKKEPEKEMANSLKRGRAEDERWHVRKDGSRFYASGVMQLLRDGEIEGFVKIARDETERLKAETVLRDKQILAQLVSMQENERRRIARDIHDHLGQQMTALRLKLDSVKKQCGDEKICDEIDELQKSVAQIDADVDFIAWELRPAALDDLGLRVTLENFLREWSRHTKIPTEFHTSGLKRTPLDFEVETNLYRIAQEALNNIYKHAKATKVSVLLEKRKDKIVLIIEDNGTGFNTNDKKIKSKGIGLGGMRERAVILGGDLEIESEKGMGTTVYARVPLVIADEKE